MYASPLDVDLNSYMYTAYVYEQKVYMVYIVCMVYMVYIVCSVTIYPAHFKHIDTNLALFLTYIYVANSNAG